jgi:uncharacterized protein (TIGR03437 family)
MQKELFKSFILFFVVSIILFSCRNEEDSKPASPSITSISVAKGVAGTSVTISGSNFGTDLTSISVLFNSAVATVTSATPTEIVVTVPPNATTGNITVTVNGIKTIGPDFTIEYVPVITAITPLMGIVGDTIAIAGQYFSPTTAENVVKINETTATIISASATELKVKVPQGATTGKVSVAVNDKKTIGEDFTVIPPPVITSLDPSAGPVGSTVTIHGNNFSTEIAENTVDVNGTAATVKSATKTELVITIPYSSTSGVITVKVKKQSGSSNTFTVLQNSASVTFDGNTYTYVPAGWVSDTKYGVSGAGTGKPSFMVLFTQGKPATNGTYNVEITAEKPGEEYEITTTTVNVMIVDGKVSFEFANVILKRRGVYPEETKPISGTVSFY